VRAYGGVNINRLADGTEDAHSVHNGTQPHTNGIDGNNLNLIGTARTYSSEGESRKMHTT
jgi:hypothetical protein